MLKLVMIGALGTMLAPAAKHLLNAPEVRVLRILDRGTPGTQREQYRKDWHAYGTVSVDSIHALIALQDFDGVVICAGKNGDDHALLQSIVPQLKPHTFILHLSTVSCAMVNASAQFCTLHHIDYVNYPLTGGALGASNASMLILAGGCEKIYQRLEPFLQHLGKPRYLGPTVDSGAVTKLVGHVLVFNGLIGISSAACLQASCHHQSVFSEEQVTLFDFLNQGAGGTRQWDVALKNGIQHDDWQKGFLLKHAAIDLIYLLQLMIEQKQLPVSYAGLFELAYCFAYLLQQGCENDATQILAQYWLQPQKSAGLQTFLTAHGSPVIDVMFSKDSNHYGRPAGRPYNYMLEKLHHCVALFPKHLANNVMLEVVY